MSFIVVAVDREINPSLINRRLNESVEACTKVECLKDNEEYQGEATEEHFKAFVGELDPYSGTSGKELDDAYADIS